MSGEVFPAMAAPLVRVRAAAAEGSVPSEAGGDASEAGGEACVRDRGGLR